MGQSWSASSQSETENHATGDKDITLENGPSTPLEVEFETQREMKVNDHSYLGDSFMLCESPITPAPDTSIVLDNATLSGVEDMTDHSCTSTCPSTSTPEWIGIRANNIIETSVEIHSTRQTVVVNGGAGSHVQDSDPVDAMTVHEKLENAIPTLDSLFHYYTVAGVPKPTHIPPTNSAPVCVSTLENLRPMLISTHTTPTSTKTCNQTQQRRRRGKGATQTNKMTLVGFQSSPSYLEVARRANSPLTHDHDF